MALRSIKCIIFALLVGWAGLSPSTGADAAEPIRIGAVLPFSGGVELYGREAIVDALAGLVIPSPTGPVTIDHDHHATMNMFIAKTQGRDLVAVRALGAITPQPGCKLADR
jgi:hypothetical protein